MNEERQNFSTVVSGHEQSIAGPWGLSGPRERGAVRLEAADYVGEDTGCRGYRREYSAEFKQILRVLGGCL